MFTVLKALNEFALCITLISSEKISLNGISNTVNFANTHSKVARDRAKMSVELKKRSYLKIQSDF